MLEFNTAFSNTGALRPRHITVGAMKRRLGVDAMAIGVSAHDACLAAKEILYDQKYVNLNDPLIPSLLDMLISANQPAVNPMFPGSGPMTQEKKDLIMNAEIQEYERP